MKRLLIAHILSGPAATFINALRQQYDVRTACAIDAHVSLAGPCNIETSVQRLEAVLARIAAAVQPFQLTITGVATFLPVTNTSYLQAEPRERLADLHDVIVARLDWQEAFPYVPHVTITEYLAPRDTANVVRQLRLLGVLEHTWLSTIALLEKAADGRWRKLKHFAVGKKNSEAAARTEQEPCTNDARLRDGS